MKARYFIIAGIIALFSGCQKSPDADENADSYNFGLSVRNEDYVEQVVLKGMGNTYIVKANNLPSWITEVSLSKEGYEGDPVALFSIKADYNMEESRSAKVSLEMSSGKTATVELTQWPIVRDGTNAAYKSANSAFEKDWSGTMELTLITGNEIINGRQEVTKKTVSLPWDWSHSPICFLPKGDGRDDTNEVKKMLDNKTDWSLVFNLTGINALPGRNYFGLYNRYTGTLRVFYYMTQDLIPENANDHLWSFSMNAALAEHIATEFALPRQEKATPNYLTRASLPVLSSPTTDAYNPLSGETSNTLAEGWWAFDVNMAAYRNHVFFNEKPLTAATIQLCTYSNQQVILNSVLKGNLNGAMQGSLNLELLRPSSVKLGAKIASSIIGYGATVMTNNFFLNEVCGGKNHGANNNDQVNRAGQVNQNQEEVVAPAPPYPQNGIERFSQTKSVVGACVTLVIGVGLSVLGKWIESWGTKKVEDKDFGALQATMNLDLNAVMATQGVIGGSTPNKVPPVSMSMDYLRQKNQDDTPTGMGEGVWNLEHHPVVYVVKDAYWCENRFTVISTQKEYQIGTTSEYPEDIYSYDLGPTKGSRPGLRLITFMDPTSIGGAALNPTLFDEKLEKTLVYLSYGVYPGSTPGYTDAFRRDLGLDYPHSWHLDIKQDGKKYSIDNLKLVKKVHTDPLFKWTEAPDEVRPVVGYRLSSQKLAEAKYPTMERRFFGQSSYFNNPYATDYIVDQAQFVYDPQVYVPFDDAGHCLYDPQVPDFVVTAMINAYGKDRKDSDDAAVSNTLRFIPKIELVSYKDLPDIMAKIDAQKQQMSGPAETIFVEMNAQIEHIRDIVNATAELRK